MTDVTAASTASATSTLASTNNSSTRISPSGGSGANGTPAAPSAPVEKESVSQLLKGIFSIKSDNKEKTKDKTKSKEKPITPQPSSQAPTTSDGSTPKTISTKEKFLDFFKSDAEKLKDAAAAAAAATTATTATPSSSPNATTTHSSSTKKPTTEFAVVTEEPIKLELRCSPAVTSDSAGASPVSSDGITIIPTVGDVIRADGFLMRTSNSLPFQLNSFGGVCRWFRASANGFDQVSETTTPIYITTMDDLDCRICCQWVKGQQPESTPVVDLTTSTTSTTPSTAPAISSLHIAQQSSFAEIGPIQMNLSIAQSSLELFQGGKAVLTVQEQETNEVVTITVKKTMIRILPAAGGEVKYSFMLLNKSNSASNLAANSSPIRLALDSQDPLSFSIEDSTSRKIFRGRMITTEDNYSKARRERDIIACLIRRIIQTGSEQLPTPTMNGSNSSGDAQPKSTTSLIVPTPSSSSATTTAASIDSTSVSSDIISATSQDVVQVCLEPASDNSPTSSSTSDLIHLAIRPIVGTESGTSAANTITLSQVTIPPRASGAVVPPPTTSSAPNSTVTTPSTGSPVSSSPSSIIPSQSPSQILSLTKRISELTGEKNSLQAGMNAILADKQQSELNSKQLIDSLQSTNQQLTNEIASLKTQLNQRGEDVDALKLAIQHLSEQMSTLANTEIRLSTEIRTLKSERDHLQHEQKREKETFQSKLQEKEEAYLKLQHEHELQSTAVTTISNELSQLRAENQRLSQLDERYTKLVEVESNLRHDIGVYKQDLIRFKEVQAKLDAVEMENHQLRKEKEKRAAAATAAIVERDHLPPQPTTTLPITTTSASVTSDGASSAASLDSGASIDPVLRLSPSIADDPTTLDALELSSSSAIASSSIPALGAPSALMTTALNVIHPSLSGSTTPNTRGDSATPMRRGSHSNQPQPAAALAAYQLLQEQHLALHTQLSALTTTHSDTLAELTRVQTELETLQSTLAYHTKQCEEHQTRLTTLTQQVDEITANRNYYKRKCDSLSSSVDRMLKEQQLMLTSSTPINGSSTPTTSTPTTPTTSSPMNLLAFHTASIQQQPSPLPITTNATNQAKSNVTSSAVSSSPPPSSPQDLAHASRTIQQLRTDLADLQQTLAAYKKTLDNTYQLLKHERDANLLLKSSASTGKTGGLFSSRSSKSQQLLHQFDSVRSLANSLSEIIADKDLSIEHLKKSNCILAARLFQLETRFEHELIEAGETTLHGHIDLEEEERKYQAQQQQQQEQSRPDAHPPELSSLQTTAK